MLVYVCLFVFVSAAVAAAANGGIYKRQFDCTFFFGFVSFTTKFTTLRCVERFVRIIDNNAHVVRSSCVPCNFVIVVRGKGDVHCAQTNDKMKKMNRQ